MKKKHTPHSSNHDCSKHNTSSNIKIAFFLNVVFTLIELVGGWITNSVAIMSDAVHDLGDSFSLGLARFLEDFSKKKRTKHFSYGYKRFSLLGAMINLIILSAGSVYILFEAIPRLISPEQTNTQGMFLLSLLGITVNGFAMWKTMKGKSLNERVVSLHMLEDVLGRVAVFIISLVMMVVEAWWLDPLLSIVIVLIILRGVFKRGRETIGLFLQAIPAHFDIGNIEKVLQKIPGVQGVHDIHLWSLDGEKHVLSTHLIVDKKISNKHIQQIKQESRKVLQEMGIDHATLEIEFDDEICMMHED